MYTHHMANGRQTITADIKSFLKLLSLFGQTTENMLNSELSLNNPTNPNMDDASTHLVDIHMANTHKTKAGKSNNALERETRLPVVQSIEAISIKSLNRVGSMNI